MKHALLLLLLAIGFREQPVAHQAPAQQTRPGCNYAYWSYYPAYTVGGFQYQPQSGYYQPQSGHYQPQSGYYQPQSGHYQPQSGYYQPQSGYYQPQSGYYQPQSGYYQPQSGYYPPHGYSYEYQHRQHQQHGTYGYAAHYPSVLPYPYPLPLPPPPPLPPHSPGPWIPGPSHPPVPPPPPAPKNVDPFPGKFLGMGSVRYVNGARDVELICNLQGDKIVSNVVWVKATNTPRQPPASWQPPCHTCGPCFCPVPTCTYQPIDYSSRRLFADAHGPQAVLHIYGVEPGDYGVYRCSATSLRSGSAMGDTETVYQIVEFTG
ncbi:calcium-binding protein P-like [Ixodes scapularis]|uniref:calcium-binding protein P-like n=1 Tax=Ixodes scapularis TaxID=6945 RepID=UPI001C38BFEF|nr:calcium-binding protein P-like [Ixodes scapularis]